MEYLDQGSFLVLLIISGVKQRDQLAAESNAFMCSGTHIVQKDCLPSALNTFVEAVTRCDPPIQARTIFRHFAFCLILLFTTY